MSSDATEAAQQSIRPTASGSRRAARRRRPILLSIVALGAVVTMAGAGTFAAFSDRATTGQNSLSSGERPRSADLKIAESPSDFTPMDCDSPTYVDNLTTPGFALTDVQPGLRVFQSFCLRNIGSATLNVTSTFIDVVDAESDCTGEEAGFDPTCGGATPGELSQVIFVSILVVDCVTGNGAGDGNFLSAAGPMVLGSLPAGATWCVQTEVVYPSETPNDDAVRAQSDSVTWKLAFDGTTN